MKKVLLPIFSLLLAASAANAQVKISKQLVNIGQTAPELIVNKQLTIGGASKVAKKAVKANELAENQKMVAMDGSELPATAIGLPGYNPTDMGQLIPASYYEAYAGSKIVGLRFLTLNSTNMTPAIYVASGSSLNLVAQGKEITTKASPINKDKTAFEQNWNEVTFDKPYTIESGSDALVVGFTYTQSSKKSGGNYTDECYPFLVGQNSDQNALVFANVDTGKGAQWQGVSDQYCLCVQLILEREGGFPDDFSMLGAYTNSMVKPSDKLPVEFYVKNLGSKEAEGEFTVSIDDQELGAFKSNDLIGTTSTKVGVNVDLSSLNLAAGPHTVGVKVKSVNGEAPVGNLKDDASYAQFRVYTNSTDRQYNLIEHFTSWTCVFCPYGYETLRELQKQRNDVAWAAIHADMDPNNPDPHTLADASLITQYSISGFPSFNLNRFNLGGSMIGAGMPSTDPAKNAEQFSKILDLEKEMVPAQLTLGMKSNFELAEKPNLQDSKLTVTVTGKGVKDAAKVLNNAVLNLYITEDGLTGKQYGKNGNSWYSKYNHDNTLIAIATDNAYGDEIAWDGDNFEKTYEITIPKKTVSYTTGKTLNAIAFVSLPFAFEQDGKLYANADLDNVWVNQCFFMDINKGETTGIKVINGTDSNATVVARFAADGTQISAPVKGVNILKMSDGTTRKVMVK